MAPDKGREGTVIGLFDFRTKTTRWQLVHTQMIIKAFAALAMLRAAGICAGALSIVLVGSFAGHNSPSPLPSPAKGEKEWTICMILCKKAAIVN